MDSGAGSCGPSSTVTGQSVELRSVRVACYFLASFALHAALVGLLSLRPSRRDLQPVIPALIGSLVTVEVAPAARLPQPKTKRPGGGGPSLRINHSPTVAKPFARRVADREAATAAPTPAIPVDERPHASETAVAAPVDVVTAPSRPNGALDKKPDSIAPPGVDGPSGTGPGWRGGPGGPGAGRGGGGVPVVSGKFPFGSDNRGAFKGVACFIRPGVLRIADVHGCAPMATFYTNTFDVSERHQGEGFPGITTRSTWFMIEYTGVFTVGKDGAYEFRLHSDDGSYLFIDGAIVIENDGKHKPESRQGSIQLRAGAHQLKLLYAQTTDRMALQLFVQVPGARFEELFTPRI
jgi:hypothetical protein